MKEELTVVYLTPEQVIEMAEMNKRYNFIKALESVGVFELKSGTVVINFDQFGQIGSIDVNKHYKI